MIRVRFSLYLELWNKCSTWPSGLSVYLLYSICKFYPMCSLYSSNCTARQCLPLRRKYMVCSIIQLALSILMKHLVIGRHQKAPNFLTFHRSSDGRMVSIGQYFVTTRVVHLPKRTETSLINESDRSVPNHQIGPGYVGRA